MVIELNEEELDLIGGWYDASAGESAHDRDEKLFALLEKLGIAANHRDLWAQDRFDCHQAPCVGEFFRLGS